MGNREVRLGFDRGTILTDMGAEGGAGVPGLMWDRRVGAHRAPACLHAAVRQALVRAGCEVRDEVMAPGDTPGPWVPPDLRPYQEAALEAWELQGRRGVVVLPTGAGKTLVALAAMSRSRLRSLCLVPTRALVEQWTQQITTRYAAPVGCFGDGRHDLAAITVATFESAYRHMDRLGNRFELLVIDEAHHFGGGVRDEALEMAAAQARLGLSATPPAGPRLDDLIGPRVFELAVGDLVGTFLASFDLVTLHLALTVTERAIYERIRAEYALVYAQFRRLVPQGSWGDFVAMASRSEGGRKALAAWRDMRKLVTYPENKRHAVASLLARHRESRVLVFTADNDTAYRIAREQLITPLTCDIGREERRLALERFRDGALRALVSARVLNEGIDVPDADVAIVVGGTQGEREHVQRIGRLLRPRPGKRAVIYELVCRDTFERKQAERRRRALAPQAAAQL
jgi:superfamily II DNA or RNA helicase